MQKDLDFLKKLGLLDEQTHSKVHKLLPKLNIQESLKLQEILVDVYLKIAKSMDLDLSDLKGRLNSKSQEIEAEFYERLKKTALDKENLEISELKDLINKM